MSTAKDYIEIKRLANGIVISEDGMVFVFSRKLGNWWMAIGRSVKDRYYDEPEADADG